MTTFLRIAPAALLLCVVLFLAGCKGQTATGRSTTDGSISASALTPTSTITARDQNGHVTFAITDPEKGGEVLTNTITVNGVGAEAGDSIVLEVLTNQWWRQDGEYDINPDGSWTYSPCYLMGKGAYRFHHSIKAKLVRGGRLVATSSIDELKAPEPSQ